MKKTILKDIDYKIQPILFISMLIMVVLQVLYRYTSFLSIPWSLEFISYVFGASVWFGISIAIKEDAHVGVTIFIDKASPKVKKAVTIFQIIIFGIFIIWLGILGFEALAYYFQKNSLTPGMRIPYYVVRSPLIFGCLLSVYRLVEKFFHTLKQ